MIMQANRLGDFGTLSRAVGRKLLISLFVPVDAIDPSELHTPPQHVRTPTDC